MLNRSRLVPVKVVKGVTVVEHNEAGEAEEKKEKVIQMEDSPKVRLYVSDCLVWSSSRAARQGAFTKVPSS